MDLVYPISQRFSSVGMLSGDARALVTAGSSKESITWRGGGGECVRACVRE